MIQLIVGEKGKGKTKVLLDRVNEASSKANGNVVFLDKDSGHMYELKNAIRLINTSDYFISSSEEFVGFVAGIISSDHDLEEIFIDRFLKVSFIQGTDIATTLDKIDKITNQFHVKCTISMSLAKDALPDSLQEKVIVSL